MRKNYPLFAISFIRQQILKRKIELQILKSQ
jgi:hypothetical protein